LVSPLSRKKTRPGESKHNEEQANNWSDWSNFEAWEERGSIATPDRANKIWKQILADFEAPPMDEAIREELQSFVELRKEQGGAPTDF
jgi:trimethylamine--corrinoid protein Co-methyltransferase